MGYIISGGKILDNNNRNNRVLEIYCCKWWLDYSGMHSSKLSLLHVAG